MYYHASSIINFLFKENYFKFVMINIKAQDLKKKFIWREEKIDDAKVRH